MSFKLKSNYQPTGDQPQAIDSLVKGIQSGKNFQTLLGVTGSGKTFTMANIIERINKPTLVIAHNKTLAAQLAQEFKDFFPENAVHYFVSYYDYYQPEAYIAKTASYIEKEASINEEIDRLRHAATQSLLTRKDVIIVASVSCIYGIGDVASYQEHTLLLEVGKEYAIEEVIERLVGLQFRRSTTDFGPGMFRVMGDILDIWSSASEDIVRCHFFGDELEKIEYAEPITYHKKEEVKEVLLFPAKHFVTSEDTIETILPKIQKELEERIKFLESIEKPIEAERIKMRVEYDMEMLQETGYVNGIENYSMYTSGRNPGDTPSTLLDFFGDDFLTFIDESHITIPQIGAMYAGDKSRKDNLIEYGFRLPSALENRPLRFDEFEKKIGQSIFVSATPSKYEAEHTQNIVEQIIRPTGLLDPEIAIKNMEYMADDLSNEIQNALQKNERVLVTTLTKKSSEDLAKYLAENGTKVQYLHSEIDTLERLEILKDFRMGKTDVIVGVNLLREGLDLPETSFIGVLDAEKVGFLRSKTSLLQIIGRAARNVHGRVTLYVNNRTKESKIIPLPIDYDTDLAVSPAMKEAIEETYRRREIQQKYNLDHDITPTTIVSKIKDIGIQSKKGKNLENITIQNEDKKTALKRLELEMDIASANLEFEKAAEIRDMIVELRGK
ncbi:excinuclease ABC subunit B [Candidatus Gracilibacteria bacterium]|nr:MAG: excinuclease ABC subunit B [Candidatus Gracilibacteria bacterium]